MDINVPLLVLAIISEFYVASQGQDKTEIGNHVINKVLNGKKCYKRVKSPKNWKVKVKLAGKLLHYICDRGTQMIGDRFSVCVDGEWSHPIPICAYGSCAVGEKSDFYPTGVEVKTHMIQESGDVSGYSYTCAAGYDLQGGDNLVYCDGKNWQGQVPSACVLYEGFTCDFENMSSPRCNWTSESDPGITWRRHSEETLLEGTGPDFDHTYGEEGTGHYLYVDSTDAPERSIAELFSPWQQAEENSCLDFWYHMHGNQTNSTLVASVQTKFNVRTFEPLWIMEGPQGDRWDHAMITLPNMPKPFRVLFQATLNSKDNSDIAIDDVSIKACDEIVVVTQQQTEPDQDTTISVPMTTVSSETPTTSGNIQDMITTTENNVKGVTIWTTNLEDAAPTASNPSVQVNPVAHPLKTKDSKHVKSKTPLVTGLVAGLAGLVAVVVGGVYIVRRRSHRDMGNDEQDTRAFAYTTMGSDTAF